jgi:hypothetical protein
LRGQLKPGFGHTTREPSIPGASPGTVQLQTGYGEVLHTTDDGSLEVVQVFDSKDGQRVLVLRKHLATALGRAEVTYRLGFSALDPTRLTSFDGTGVQPWPATVETWTNVPLKGRFVRWTPDCPFVLEGVPGP